MAHIIHLVDDQTPTAFYGASVERVIVKVGQCVLYMTRGEALALSTELAQAVQQGDELAAGALDGDVPMRALRKGDRVRITGNGPKIASSPDDGVHHFLDIGEVVTVERRGDRVVDVLAERDYAGGLKQTVSVEHVERVGGDAR